MNFEPSRKFAVQDDDIESTADEGCSLSRNISILHQNEFRLFLDCDNKSVQETTIKKHDFNFLVKPNPFQKAQPELFNNHHKIQENETKLCDLSTSSSARKEEYSPLVMSPIQENKNITFSESNANRQTFPKGILKLGQKCRYTSNSTRETKRIKRQESLGLTRWAIDWESLENNTTLSDIEETADLNSNLRRGTRIIRSQNKHNTLPGTIPTKKPSLFKIQVNKVRKLLSLKKSLESKEVKEEA